MEEIESLFDVESQRLANEIGALARELGLQVEKPDQVDVGDALRMDYDDRKEKVLSSWQCEAFVHSNNKIEPIHIGLGTSLKMIKGIPGWIFFTESSVVFFSMVDRIESIGVENVFAYVALDFRKLRYGSFMPTIRANYLEFENHGLFKQKFPGVDRIFIHYSWNQASDVNLSVQIANHRKTIASIVKARLEPILFPGNYAFIVGASADNPQVRTIIRSLKQVPAIFDTISGFRSAGDTSSIT